MISEGLMSGGRRISMVAPLYPANPVFACNGTAQVPICFGVAGVIYELAEKTDVSDQKHSGKAKENEKTHAIGGEGQQHAGTNGWIPTHPLHKQWHQHAN